MRLHVQVPGCAGSQGPTRERIGMNRAGLNKKSCKVQLTKFSGREAVKARGLLTKF